MIVYQCWVTGDEMITDAFKHNPVMVDGEEMPGLFEVESSTTVKGADNVDIGCGNAFGGDEEEVADDGAEKVNNVIDPFQYTEVPFGSKVEFRDYLKEYVRKVRSCLKEAGTPQPEIKEFMGRAPEFVKYLLGMYNEFQFYSGPSFNPEGSMAFAYYKEGAHNPTFMYIADGLKVVKF
ncbi:unnamed protein product [Chrysoparadoxa australica]